jgi:hypothetical protein
LVGDSYQINYWYVDDVVLFESVQYDAQVDAILIPPQIPTGNVTAPGAVVTNMGSETVTFDAVFEILNGTTAVYSDTYTVSNLAAFESMVIEFADWTAVLGDYTAMITVDLTGDENPDNDMLEKDIQVLDGMVFKKPLYEEFTSSTCGPCVAANEVILAVLGANPDEYSLIKYQMNWPGSGDIYYTQEGGDRKDYYGCSWVPDLYINSNQIDPAASLTQAMFDLYAEEVTAMEIEVTSSIDEAGIITVDATISSNANYPAGLKAHIVVIEKVTVGNVGSNGETEFHNVMMKMLPGSAGTTLGAISQGGSVDLSESYDMGDTNMEEPTDLAVVVFVQNDSNKEVIQSEVVEVESSGFITFDVTFNVKDSDGNVVEGADLFMQGQGSNTTNAAGVAVYDNVFPGTYTWEVEADGLFPESGSVTVTDQNVSVDVVLEIPEFYFFEDFATELPADWTSHYTGWDNVYWYGGKVILFDQTATTNPVMLVTPMIDLSVVTSVTAEVGENGNGTGHIIFGTISDPTDPSTFTALETFEVSAAFEYFTVDMTGYTGTDSYFAFNHQEAQSNFFSITTVMMEAGSGPPPGDVLEDFEAYAAGDFLVEQANTMGRDYWTTWSGSPGSAEDPMVSSDQAYMGSNSVVIEGTNDAVLLFGNKTVGKHAVNFNIYIPDGFFGYFNLLQDFAGTNSQWGMQAYFDAGGLGLVDAGAAGAGVFNYSYDTWTFVELIIDLDMDFAQMFVEDDLIVEWVWSSGSFGTGTLNQLGAMNLYAWAENGTPKAYFDDIDFYSFTNVEIYEDFEAYDANDYIVEQALAMGIDYWTCWSGDGGAGTTEDGTVSTEQAYMGDNSVLCDGVNDFVMLFGDKVAGKYSVDFQMYIPSGFVGYYNILQAWAPNGTGATWGLEVYFDPGGLAVITADGAAGIDVFNFPYDEWIHIENIINLNMDEAAIIVNGVEEFAWQWSVGASGGGLNQLAAMDIYAAATNGTPYFFIDEIQLIELEPAIGPPTIAVDPAYLNVTLESGQTQDEMITISNSGIAPLEWNAFVQFPTLNKGVAQSASRSSSAATPEYKSIEIPQTSMTTGAGEVYPYTTDDITLNYDGDNASGVGLTNGGTFQVGARFTSDMTGNYIGMEVYQVDVYVYDVVTASKVIIYGHGSEDAPGAMLAEQSFNAVVGWNTIGLSNPVVLSGGDLWVTAELTHVAGLFVAGNDAGPHTTNGDWFKTGASWVPMHIANPAIDANWNIRATAAGTPMEAWLTLDPMSGDIPGGEEGDLTVTFNAAGMDDGTYMANIIFNSNDPATPQVIVPVTMVVDGGNLPGTLAELTFEEQNDWDVTFGDWSVNDVDMQTTYGFTGITFPGAYEAMAYIAFNPATTDPPMIDDPEIQPFAGERFGACMASTAAPWNNDWIISPQLQLGTSSVFTFMAKSYTADYGLEKFNVGVSTTGMAPGDFTMLNTSVIEVPVAWTDQTFDISAYDGDEVYVAIQCVSQDAFVFMIDNLMVESITGIQENEKNNISIYPNPASNLVNITCDVQINSIRIINYTGQVVYNQSVSGNNVQVNTNDFSAGVYFINVNTSKGIATQKLLIK